MGFNPEKLQDIPKRSCRNCQNFVLINKDRNPYRVLNRRGFCLYGQLEGDYSLYYSSTQSRDCEGYVFCSELNIIMEHHKALQHGLNELLRKIIDRRSREYKQIKPVLDGIKEYQEVKFSKSGWGPLTRFKYEEQVATKYYQEKNREEYIYLHRSFME